MKLKHPIQIRKKFEHRATRSFKVCLVIIRKIFLQNVSLFVPLTLTVFILTIEFTTYISY